jgi:hypothetical protein
MSEADFDELYGSKYLDAADLKGKEPRVVIRSVETVELKDKAGLTKRKYVLSFEGAGKSLVVNKTNAQALAGALGKNTDKWIGQFIQLYAADTQFGPGVRVRPVQRAVAKPSTQSAPMEEDSVPF